MKNNDQNIFQYDRENYSTNKIQIAKEGNIRMSKIMNQLIYNGQYMRSIHAYWYGKSLEGSKADDKLILIQHTSRID